MRKRKGAEAGDAVGLYFKCSGNFHFEELNTVWLFGCVMRVQWLYQKNWA